MPCLRTWKIAIFQLYVARDVTVVYYMDDIMLVHPRLTNLERMSSQMLLNLETSTWMLLQKNSESSPYAFLGFSISEKIKPWLLHHDQRILHPFVITIIVWNC